MPRVARSRAIIAVLFALVLGLSGGGGALALPPAAAGRPLDLGDRAFVLCWHTFLGVKSLNTDFSLAEVEAQLDALTALGYHFIDLDDALFGRIEGSMNLVATIDDGHRTISTVYAKVFASRGIKPALLVYPAVIGGSPYFLKPEQLRTLADSGLSVGAHGYYHLFVTEKLYKSDRSAFEKEIFKAKTSVEALSGLPAYFYAYPFGAFDQVTKAEVKRAGYDFGLAVKPGFVFADSRLNDPYEIPRTVVLRDGWDALLAFLARNAGSARIVGPQPQTWTESDEFPAPELWTGEQRIR
jgi:peptidoglycan/xylan/chitin deacetylase (PgdA/CDA1 family)